MNDVAIEQIILRRIGDADCRVHAKSAGITDEWLSHVEHLCVGFGARPPAMKCPSAVFARPWLTNHVAVVQVSDLDGNSLGFRFLIVPVRVYFEYIGDPFAVAELFSPSWHMRGELPVLMWPEDALRARTVDDVQRVLQRVDKENGAPMSPVLLGAAQALVDGSHIAFQRPGPDTTLLRDLWTLLPHSTRNHLWPASFAFGNSLGFDVLVAPEVNDEAYRSYLTEEQAADYPQGRYELSLQIAAEAGDQDELDALFAREVAPRSFASGCWCWLE